MSTLIRYCLFQIPGAMLIGILVYLGWQWGWMNGYVALTVMAVWLIKDALLYPLYRPALEGGAATGARALIGATGRARTDLTPRGLVEVDGERWQARAAKGQTIHAGQRIRVYAASGMVLRVEALQE